jgi:Rad3-related DNA helicase
MYENSFSEYAVPQAILRLRQGFGRLIRTRSDRGVAVVLDRRILSRRYGRTFLESLPPVSRRDCRLRDLGSVVRDWLGA